MCGRHGGQGMFYSTGLLSNIRNSIHDPHLLLGMDYCKLGDPGINQACMSLGITASSTVKNDCILFLAAHTSKASLYMSFLLGQILSKSLPLMICGIVHQNFEAVSIIGAARAMACDHLTVSWDHVSSYLRGKVLHGSNSSKQSI